MKNLLNKTYDLFSSRLNKWFIFAGVCALCLSIFIKFLGSVIELPQESFYYILVLVFDGLIAAGILVGHYKSKEPVLLVSLIVFLAFLFSSSVVNSAFGMSFIGNAPTPSILDWVFTFIYGISLGVFLVCLLLTYLFKVKKVQLVVKASFFLTLAFGILYWVFNLVSLADGANWTSAILPLLEVVSLLMVPGLLEELLPGELDELRAEENSESEE